MLRLGPVLAAGLVLAVAGQAPAQTGSGDAGRLAAVKQRGQLACLTYSGTPGLAEVTAELAWQGFYPGLCKAVAAAVLGDASAVTFNATTTDAALDQVGNGEADIFAGSTSMAMTRVARPDIAFAGPVFYDQQKFAVRREDAQGRTIADFDGASVCVSFNPYLAANVRRFADESGIALALAQQDDLGINAFLSGDCRLYSFDQAIAASLLEARAPDPSDYMFLDATVSHEPMGLVVPAGHSAWRTAVAATVDALLLAESYGVTQERAGKDDIPKDRPRLRFLWGEEGELGEALGLDPDWAKRAVAAVGHYGELFQRTLGADGLGLDRGKNRLPRDGGALPVMTLQ